MTTAHAQCASIKYIFLGDRRIARRIGTAPKFFFHADHLDSVRVVTHHRANSSSMMIGEIIQVTSTDKIISTCKVPARTQKLVLGSALFHNVDAKDHAQHH